MKFIADFHIHSRFSRATAKTLDFENLYIAAQLKGVTVVGTGDFTHPGWFSEITAKLVPAEQGLFQLDPQLARSCDQKVPPACRAPVRFILVTEISNIYKKDEKTRKNHNLVFAPDLGFAERFSEKLDAIGNIRSDGRPILGLDARDLLEIILEISDQSFLVPAHIWTPWFSVLGSKSGFDSLQDCFEDLTHHIFAAETGLSSDPPMNWRISDLDGITLISNSDAHSPLNLGREANLFDADLSYGSIKRALAGENADQFLGTLEFYPEEGKYHFDGHRKCQVRFHPEMSRKHDGRCPVCNKPLTLGVLYRVEELADRAEGARPERLKSYTRLIPLNEILSELLGTGTQSKRVREKYDALLSQKGPELDILQTLPVETLKPFDIPLLPEAIGRMRNGKVLLSPGYDGEYGKITLFAPEEKMSLTGQKTLFRIDAQQEKPEQNQSVVLKPTVERQAVAAEVPKKDPGLNDPQRRAVEHGRGPVLVVAGPGTGKTRTLTHRIAYLIEKKCVLSENILAVTFTNKAAEEMRNRLIGLLPEGCPLPLIGTFHGLCMQILKEQDPEKAPVVLDEEQRKKIIRAAAEQVEQDGKPLGLKPGAILAGIVSAKQQFLGPQDPLDSIVPQPVIAPFRAAYGIYQEILSIEGFVDYEDLIFRVVARFKKDPIRLKHYQDRFRFIFIDEYQDLNQGQYRLIRALSPPLKDLFVIGDPDQSIYGFRGSDRRYFVMFKKDYPTAEVISLTRNYRSTQTILDASQQVIDASDAPRGGMRVYSNVVGHQSVQVMELQTERAEAVAVGRTIEALVGGTGFHSVDFGTVDAADPSPARSFADVAVLYRTGAQGEIFAGMFHKAGIPYQMVSKESVYSQQGVAELISLFKVLAGSGCYSDLEDVCRVTVSGVGKGTLDLLRAWGYRHRFSLSEALWHARRIPIAGMRQKDQQKLYELLRGLDPLHQQLEALPLEEGLRRLAALAPIQRVLKENPKSESAVERLIQISTGFEGKRRDFFSAAALQADSDIYDHNVEKVALMTMHAAKGLEFPIVFITGCEDGLIPHHLEGADPQEERRLFYVAMTRAKDRLFLTYARKRSIFGKKTSRTLSPFVVEIEASLKNHEKAAQGSVKPKPHRQLKLF